VESIIGGRQLAILYLIGAYAAAGAQYVVSPCRSDPDDRSERSHIGGPRRYSMLFGRNKVKVANPTLALWLNALWLAAGWVVLQLIVGLTFDTSGAANIAVAAHIGGFLAGLLLAKPLLLLRYRTRNRGYAS
jgi:membrane associated rhomboid family serine protease